MIKSLRIFFDADALIAGSASQTGASFLLLQLCELGLLQGLTSEQVIAECRKNLQLKLPAAIPVFEEIVQRTLSVCSNPGHDDMKQYPNMAHEKDLPVLVAAILHAANFLVTFNTRHYYPSPELDLTICQPGELLQTIRKRLNELAD